VLFTNTVFSQKTKDTTIFENKNVLISTGYKPIIHDAEKINASPEINEIEKKTKEFNYLLFPRPVKAGFGDFENVPYVTMHKYKVGETDNGLLKLGIGTLINPDLMFSFSDKLDENILYGIRANHYSRNTDFDSDNGINISSPYNNTEVNLNFLKLRKTNTFYTNLNYNLEGYNYYGFNDIKDTVENDESQTVHRLDWIFAVKSNKSIKKYDLKYETLVNYRLFYSDDKNSENHISLDTKISNLFEEKPFNFLSDKYDYQFDFDFGIKYINYDINNKFIKSAENNSSLKDTVNLDNSKVNISLAPSFDIISNASVFKIGLDMNIYSGIDENYFNVFPKIDFKYNLYEDVLALNLGIGGGIKQNTVFDITKQNRYVNQVVVPDATIEKLNLYGSFNINFSDKASLNTYASFKFVENEIFFINDTIAVNKFNVVNDDLKQLNIGAHFNLEVADFKIDSRFDFYKYILTDLEQPWHKPTINWNTGIAYQLNDKVNLSTNFRLISGIKAIDKYEGEKTLSSIALLDIKCKYEFWKNFDFYVSVNNLLQNQNSIWNNYYRENINLNIGLLFKF
jgi:hypothetical protein